MVVVEVVLVMMMMMMMIDEVEQIASEWQVQDQNTIIIINRWSGLRHMLGQPYSVLQFATIK